MTDSDHRKPPEPGATVHYTEGVSPWNAEMTFLCVDPDDPDIWIVRDGEYELDGYLCSHLALGPRPNGDADE